MLIEMGRSQSVKGDHIDRLIQEQESVYRLQAMVPLLDQLDQLKAELGDRKSEIVSLDMQLLEKSRGLAMKKKNLSEAERKFRRYEEQRDDVTKIELLSEQVALMERHITGLSEEVNRFQDEQRKLFRLSVAARSTVNARRKMEQQYLDKIRAELIKPIEPMEEGPP